VFVSRYQSGSVRYYSGRLTVRWDYILPDQLETVLNNLRQRGDHPYIVVEPFERSEFAERFRGHTDLADLDWPPVAEHESSHVRIYDPADRSRAPTSRRAATAVIR